MKILNVLVDNGHGAETPGKRSNKWPNGTQLFEWEYNRWLAKELMQQLSRYPQFKVVEIVPESRDIGLTTRCNRANRYGASTSIFISLHGNAGPEPAKGFEIYTTPGKTKSDILAEYIWDGVDIQFNHGAGKIGDRNSKLTMRADTSDGDHDKEERFTVIAKTKMPAVLIEAGFFTNYQECQNMLNAKWREDMCEGIVRGILNYYDNNYCR